MPVPAVMLLENKGNLKWGYRNINSRSNFSTKAPLVKRVWFPSVVYKECFSSCKLGSRNALKTHISIKSVTFRI